MVRGRCRTQGCSPLQNCLISQTEFVEVTRAVLDAEKTFDHRYSTFETATAAALLWFAQREIDFAVLEVGIGGRFDAVNAVENTLAVFTPIEAEHVAMLGGSLESVAWHKAGIIQPGGMAISVPQQPQVLAVLEREAQAKGAELKVVDVIESGYFALPNLQAEADPSDLFGKGGQETLPGRLERLTIAGCSVIVDGGHTPNAARHLRRAVGDPSSLRLIVGMLRDKDVAAYLSAFDAPNVHIVYTRAPGDRALTPDDLLAQYRPSQASFSLEPSLDQALKQVYSASEALIVIAGSLRMAAAAREAYDLLTAEELEEARLTRAIFEGTEYQAKID